MLPRNVKSTWWVGTDLHIEYKDGQVDVFKDAHIKDAKVEYARSSGVEVEELPFSEGNAYSDLLEK